MTIITDMLTDLSLKYDQDLRQVPFIELQNILTKDEWQKIESALHKGFF
mgnify:FL=1|jgi:hypothetical protein|tara:strand:- start:2090 stop:2236 length:147 start_codon:yes stop_codon:yes gene_type:complete